MKEISIGFYVSAEGWVLWLFLVSSATERSDFFAVARLSAEDLVTLGCFLLNTLAMCQL